EADVDAAVAAARDAFANGWSSLPGSERAKYLFRIARLLQERARELAVVESIDGGKPIRESRDVDIPLAAAHFFYYAGWADKLQYGVAGRKAKPHGVVGQIVPWNFPLLMAAWKLAPALACGNAAILKPAETTPLTALLLAEICQEAELPAGVANIIPGDGVAGAALVRSDVDKVAFTGSTDVGKAIVRGSTGNLKKVSLELGGKSPQIVLADADLDAAAASVASGIFFNQGQTCTAGSRLYAHASIHDELLARIADHASRLTIGNGLDPGVDFGPLVSQEQWDRVSSYVEIGRNEGAEVMIGGGRPEGLGEGFFFEPTIMADAGPDMRIVREEIFGPVLSALRWTDPEDLVAQANDSDFGLSAGIWTNDIKQAHRLAAAVKAGTVWVNCFNLVDNATPFGGFKQSGWGREHGRQAMELYSETKSVWVNLS
ncbi:MAG: aldehyde dehydrogenase family protein, partial [Croceibacterium sp.]